MLGIERDQEPWVAYCLDRAVTTFGTAVQGELDAVEGKTKKELEIKRQRVLNRFFPEQAQYKGPGKR